jgi:CubicO group peptidase (beta-lactamase class C family)
MISMTRPAETPAVTSPAAQPTADHENVVPPQAACGSGETRRAYLAQLLAAGATSVGRSLVMPLATIGSAAMAQAAGGGEPGAPAPAEQNAMAVFAKDFMAKYSVPGLSVAVGHGGRIIYTDAFGVADRDNREQLTPSHLFRIASVTKPITSVAIFTLIEQGRLRLGDRVFGPGAVLGADFGGPPYQPRVDQITIEHLLTHTCGGWSNDRDDPMFMRPKMNHAELIAWTLQNKPLEHPPGQNYAYSNFGYCLLGRVIEKVTHQTYADFVEASVLRRCGVTEMSIAGNTLAERRPGEVVYYDQDNENPYTMNVARMDSHGGWIARPAALVRFAMHVSGFAMPANILKPETIRTMTTASAASASYAKGWNVNRFGNWWHDGSLPGTSTIMVRTHSGFCWAAFTNTRRSKNGGDLDGLVWKLVGAVKNWHA